MINYIFKNIKTFATKDTLVFVLFLICEISASLVILISYGTYANFKLLKNDAVFKESLNIYFGNVIEETEFDGQMIYSCDGTTDNASVKNFLYSLDENALSEIGCIFYTAYDFETSIDSVLNDYSSAFAFRLEYDKSKDCFVPYSVSNANTSCVYGRPLSEEEYISGDKLIVLPTAFAYEATEEYMGSEITVQGEKYKVLGVDFYDSSCTIPFFNSPDTLKGISLIELEPKSALSQAGYDKIVEVAKQCFGDYAYIPQVSTVDDNLPYYNSIILLAVLLTALSATILTLLFRYVLMTRNKMISVMRMCGMSVTMARRMFISEVMILSVGCTALVCAVYFNFIVYKLESSYEYITKVYSSKNMVITGLLYMAVTYIIVNLMITARLKSTPITQKSIDTKEYN